MVNDGQLTDAMKMKVATVGGIADSIRMSGVPESMKRGEEREGMVK